MFRTTLRSVLVFIALTYACTAAPARAEDFTVFLKKFIRDVQFRSDRVITSLPADLTSDCDDEPRHEIWNRAAVKKNLIVPLSRNELEAQYLSQQITKVSRNEISVFQFREEADSYLITYTFRRRSGHWYLVGYRDASC